jgi:hypothetical protein
VITVIFNIILALGIMILTYVTAVHKLLISRQMSDKFYKNFAFAILAFGVYVNCTAVILTATNINWMIDNIRARELSFERLNDMANNLITNINRVTGYHITAIAFYLLTLLLIKSILKDIEKETNKPKYRWGKLNEKSTID